MYLTGVALVSLACFALLPETNPLVVRVRRKGPRAGTGTGAAEAAAPV